MNQTNVSRRFGRSVAAVCAGIVAAIAVTLITDFLLHACGVFPPWGQRVPDSLLLLATAYRTIYGVGAGYLTARGAPYRPMRHALVGGAFGFVAAAAGAAATWNGGPAYEPHWYPLALIALALPQSWFGGWLRLLQVNARQAS